MSQNEFIKIYVNASDEVKFLIEEILSSLGTPPACREEVAQTDYIIPSPFPSDYPAVPI